MLRAKIKLKTNYTKKRCTKHKKIDPEIITTKNKEYLTTLEAKLTLIGTELTNEDLDTHADLLTTIERESEEEIKADVSRASEKLSDQSSKLFQIRREMRPNKQEFLIEWSELNKLIRKNVGENIKEYNTRVIRDTIENNRGPKIF
ncbi:hypothetical protein HHI36_019923 [Cryptolaemus montrouzieri]|uniref:Uncharacterized protein n=1 Tax=Cryptolaemus montrouzieri TaxID=559131 RepID=A0ABD2N964_9CUCU